MIVVTQNKFEEAVEYLSERIRDLEHLAGHQYNLAGIPQGGIPVVMAIAELTGRSYSVVGGSGFVDDPDKTIIIDDLVDSGETMLPWLRRGFTGAVLGHKPSFKKVDIVSGILISALEFKQEWVQFWWEPGNDKADPERNITRVLQFLGEDVNRNGLKVTPARVVRSWEYLYGGYG